MYIYICMYVCMYVYIYIYIYRIQKKVPAIACVLRGVCQVYNPVSKIQEPFAKPKNHGETKC